MNKYLLAISVLGLTMIGCTTTNPDSAENETEIEEPAPLKTCGFSEVEMKATHINKARTTLGHTTGYSVEVGAGVARITTKAMNETCTARISKVTPDKVWELASTRHFLFSTGSGSNKVLTLVDGVTCETLWNSPRHKTADVGEARIDFQEPNAAWVLDTECKLVEGEPN